MGMRLPFNSNSPFVLGVPQKIRQAYLPTTYNAMHDVNQETCSVSQTFATVNLWLKKPSVLLSCAII